MFAPLMDDLSDVENISSKTLLSLVRDPLHHCPTSDMQQVAKDMLVAIHKLVSHNKFYWENYAESLVRWQENKKDNPSPSDAWETTIKKGGFSMLIARGSSGHPISSDEAKILTQMGACIQLLDDIFDIREDLLNEVRTVPTTCNNCKELGDFYAQQVDTLFAQIRAFHPKGAFNKVFITILSSLFSFGTTALWQYSQLDNFGEGTLHSGTFSRRQLVCDMARFKNQKRWFYSFCQNTWHAQKQQSTNITDIVSSTRLFTK